MKRHYPPPLDLTVLLQKSRSDGVNGSVRLNTLKKTSLLLHFNGMDVQDIFEDLQDPGPIPESGDNVYKIAIRKLDSYFRVEENIPYERHVFRQLTQREGETADQFIVRLRKQARHCDFGAGLNDHLRDQLIEKLTNFELKRKLLEHRNITLEEALNKARAWEASGRQATNMSTSLWQVEGDDVSAVRGRQDRQGEKGRRGYNCGKEGHLARDSNCPVKGRKCSKCDGYEAKDKTSEPERVSCGRSRQNANFVGDQEASDNEEHCAFAFTLSENRKETCNSTSCKEPVLEVSVSGVTTQVLIDSGSVSNLMGLDEYRELKARGPSAVMEESHKRLYAYGGGKLEVIGHISAEISVGGRQ